MTNTPKVEAANTKAIHTLFRRQKAIERKSEIGQGGLHKPKQVRESWTHHTLLVWQGQENTRETGAPWQVDANQMKGTRNFEMPDLHVDFQSL